MNSGIRFPLELASVHCFGRRKSSRRQLLLLKRCPPLDAKVETRKQNKLKLNMAASINNRRARPGRNSAKAVLRPDSADVQFLAGLQQELRNRREAIPVRGKDEVWDAIYARMDDGAAVSDTAQPETGRLSCRDASVPSGTAAQQAVSAQPDGSSDSVPFHPAARPRSQYRPGWVELLRR